MTPERHAAKIPGSAAGQPTTTPPVAVATGGDIPGAAAAGRPRVHHDEVATHEVCCSCGGSMTGCDLDVDDLTPADLDRIYHHSFRWPAA